MKRLHVHVAVPELSPSIAFYSALFGAEPSVVKPDYAKWMLEDPRVNFAISARGAAPGVNHLGIQAESACELAGLRKRMAAADGPVIDEGETTCCYANSDKSWITDPSGVAWEAYHTMSEAAVFGAPAPAAVTETPQKPATACCG
jgi:catechol 2,3-dioxygenase-like lactoylglutathione lyase family enzyme